MEKAIGPLNTKKGCGRHSLQRHNGVTGVDVFTRSAATITFLPTESDACYWSEWRLISDGSYPLRGK